MGDEVTGSASRRPAARRTHRRIGFGLFAVQVGIILLVGAVAAGIAVFAQIEQVRRGAESDLLVLARSIATLPVVIDGLTSDDPTTTIQPVAAAMQEAAGVEYITVADMNGIRVAHPQSDLIGEPVSSDHSAVRAGEEFSGSESGPMGLTLRSKVPVIGGNGEVIGTVSVGLAQNAVDQQVLWRVAQVSVPTLVAVLVGVGLAWAVTTGLRRRLYGVRTDEMLAMVQAHQAVTNGVRDGIIGVDSDDRIAVVNSEAQRLLSLDPSDSGFVGMSAKEVLPASVLGVLSADTERLTRQVTAAGRTLIATRSPAIADGRDVGAMVVLQDRSELDAMLETLELERTRTETLRIETHDFENRMHVVSGLLGLGDLDDARAYLAALPRGERPGDARQWAPLRSPLMAALLASRQAQAKTRGIELALTDDSRIDVGFVCGPEEITVVGNLVSNAIEAAHDSVDVFLRGDAEGLDIVVDDDGAGLADDEADAVFAPGNTSKTSDAWRHGIGLDVVRAYVQERGGFVSVGRADAGGARFTAHLPSATPTDDDTANKEPNS
ncbi:ATP-binding protein [Microbacterium sp. K2]|uniref:ATP-binding protein n=1 Tax=Microbacterium sp. K2 TaxID=3391827 RepID=UPI003ED97BC9